MINLKPELVSYKTKSILSAVPVYVYHGNNDIAGLLIRRGVVLSLFDASATGKPDVVRGCIESVPSLAKSFSADGFTPLPHAAFFWPCRHMSLPSGIRL